MIVIVAIFISISTALVGPITFLGLIVVNIARQMIKTYKHKYLITSVCINKCIRTSKWTIISRKNI